MPVNAQPTPNPNAMKFAVGVPVGGPVTYRAGKAPDHPLAADVLAIEGVSSVFWTADFVTVQKHEGQDWDGIKPAVMAVLKEHFPEA